LYDGREARGTSEGYSDFVAMWVRFAKAVAEGQTDLYFGSYSIKMAFGNIHSVPTRKRIL
jgi:hypothetical protein